jgi:hypothetical protein
MYASEWTAPNDGTFIKADVDPNTSNLTLSWDGGELMNHLAIYSCLDEPEGTKKTPCTFHWKIDCGDVAVKCIPSGTTFGAVSIDSPAWVVLDAPLTIPAGAIFYVSVGPALNEISADQYDEKNDLHQKIGARFFDMTGSARREESRVRPPHPEVRPAL